MYNCTFIIETVTAKGDIGEGTAQSRQAKRGLLVLCSAAFLVPFMGSALNLALPDIGREFSMNAVMLTWMATAYIISTAIFQIPFARVADIVGRRKIFMIGVFIFAITTAACAFAPNGHVLIGLRFLSGIGSAMMFGTNIAILTSIFPPEKRGYALGINAAVVYAALAAGPFVGGMLTHYFGWHYIFVVPAALGLAVFGLSHFFLKGEWTEARGQKFDLVGSLLYGVGLGTLIYGFTSLPHPRGFICLGTGLVCLLLFGRYELRHSSPVFNLRLFSGNRVFTLSSVAALINYAATSAIAFILSLYLQYVRGLDASHAGLILICQAVVQSCFSLVAGRLSTRHDPSRMATAGMAIIVVGLFGLIFLSTTTPYWMIIGLLMLLGVGFGIFSSPNTNVIMGSVDRKDYSAASAATGTMRLTGQAVSMGIAGMAISFHVGTRNITAALFPEFMQSLRTTFIIFALLCMVGVYASTARVSRRGNSTTI
ncbi:MAG: MFS transporter [Rikenellaceae bacterium]|nr:MFS transporter [Rikenellaceae bacterium]